MSRRCPRRCLATVRQAARKKHKRTKRAEKKRRKRLDRIEVAQEVVACIMKKARAREDAKPTVHRTVMGLLANRRRRGGGR